LIGWPRLIALMTIEPARLCNLDRRGLGKLAAGGPADVTVIDPDHAWTISAADIKGKSSNTPFMERRVTGRAAWVIVGGRVVKSGA